MRISTRPEIPQRNWAVAEVNAESEALFEGPDGHLEVLRSALDVGDGEVIEMESGAVAPEER